LGKLDKSKEISVLIVDDSAVVRRTLVEILSSHKNIRVLGAASDPYIAAKKIAKEVPDVITLDVEMPNMDGLTFLKKIMTQRPIPTVIISSLTEKGSKTAIRALEYGAIDIITKPRMDSEKQLAESKTKIIDAVLAASMAKIRRLKEVKLTVTPKHSADVIIRRTHNNSLIETTDKIVAIGASTGGTEAIRTILKSFPSNGPGVIIVQHMPEIFTRSFADRLNQECNMDIKEAENNDSIFPGRVLIAPGNKHMLLKRSGARYFVEIKEGPFVNRHRPSVDVLFRSVAKYAGSNAIGAILTGMGDDGAKGLLEMKEAGAKTIGQDEQSCVVYGMPQVANNIGALNVQLPLDHIASFILKSVK
jgi:two-component system chemotaxis response regulator CheB